MALFSFQRTDPPSVRRKEQFYRTPLSLSIVFFLFSGFFTLSAFYAHTDKYRHPEKEAHVFTISIIDCQAISLNGGYLVFHILSTSPQSGFPSAILFQRMGNVCFASSKISLKIGTNSSIRWKRMTRLPICWKRMAHYLNIRSIKPVPARTPQFLRDYNIRFASIERMPSLRAIAQEPPPLQ